VSRRRSRRPIADELRELLVARGLSLRSLAKEIGVDQAYLSRIIGPRGAEESRRPSRKVLTEISRALDLPDDYFPEYRQLVVIDALRDDLELSDRVYDSLKRRP
jgi:transcriptional regulator with XRE-family HTH domain